MQTQQQSTPTQSPDVATQQGTAGPQAGAGGAASGASNQDRLADMRASEEEEAAGEEEVEQQDAEGELQADSDQDEPPETDASPEDAAQESDAEEPETPESDNTEAAAEQEGEAQGEQAASEEEVQATEATPEAPAVDDAGRAAGAASTLSTAVTGLGAMDTVDFAGVDVGALFGPDASPEELREADARFQGERAYSAAAIDGFVANVAVRAQDLDATGQQLQAELAAASAQAQAAVQAELAASIAAVTAGIDGMISQARSAAEGLRGTIQGAYDATVATIETACTTGHATLETSLSAADAQIDVAAEAQIATVDGLYAQCGPAFAAAGDAAGQLAMTEAAARSSSYLGGKIWREDGPLDGYLTDNRCDAQAEAATKVGECYRDELKKAADEQADAARERQPTDEEAVWSIADETRAQILAAFDGAAASLDTGRDDSLANAESVRASLVSGVDQAETDTIAGLEAHRDTTTSALDAQATTAIDGIIALADTGSADLTTALADAATGIQTSLQGLLDQLGGADAPPPDAVDEALATADVEIQTAIDSVLAGVDAGKQEVLAGLSDSQAQAITGLQTTTQGALDGGQQTLDGLYEGLAGLEAASVESFDGVVTAHQQTVDDTTDGLDSGICDLEAGLDSAYGTLGEQLSAGFTQQAQTVQDGLENAVRTDMGPAITTEARKAYDQVQPRWKSVLKWVLIIAVVLLVAIVLGPMVIGAVTGLAAGMGASAAVAGVIGTVVGGAIVGAGTAAATTVIDNGFSGRDLTEGIWQAMAIGALGGALGGAGGLLTKGLSGMSQFGASVALDMVIDTGINIGTGNFTWENFGVGLLMSAFTNGISMNSRVQGWQQSNMARGYGAGYNAGQGLHGLATGNAYDGPSPTIRSDHVNSGDSAGAGSPYEGKWNMRGGGHNADAMTTRAADDGYSQQTVATDPVNGSTIQEYTRTQLDNAGNPIPDATNPGQNQTRTVRKSTFPDSMGTADVDAAGTQVLTNALSGAPNTTNTPPVGNGNGSFSGTAISPDGHPIPVQGHYKMVDGVPQVETVYPQSNLNAGTFPDHAPTPYTSPPSYGNMATPQSYPSLTDDQDPQ